MNVTKRYGLTELLEGRRLLSGDAAGVHGGVLHVRGTAGDDRIAISIDAPSTPANSAVVVVNVNGTAFRFPARLVRGLSVFAGAGDDHVVNNTALPSRIAGGEGNDEILGGRGNDNIEGGPGDDAINGRAGNDRLNGGEGDDIVLGGEGNDMVIGGAGVDTVTGGLGRDAFAKAEYDAGEVTDYTAGEDRLLDRRPTPSFVAGTSATVAEQVLAS